MTNPSHKNIEDVPIKSLSQAKTYFMAMYCNHFHLDRAQDERAEEYYGLNINRETENGWTREWIDQEMKEYHDLSPNDKYFVLDRIKSALLPELNYYNELFKNLEELTNEEGLELRFALGMIIGGNASIKHGGLIQTFHEIGMIGLRDQAINLALKLFERADKKDTALPFQRGNFVDVICALRIKMSNARLRELQEKDNIDVYKLYKRHYLNGEDGYVRYLLAFKDNRVVEDDFSFIQPADTKRPYQMSKEEREKIKRSKRAVWKRRLYHAIFS